jgi:hypothetical protein
MKAPTRCSQNGLLLKHNNPRCSMLMGSILTLARFS